LNSAAKPDESDPLGATASGDEVNFSLFSGRLHTSPCPAFHRRWSIDEGERTGRGNSASTGPPWTGPRAWGFRQVARSYKWQNDPHGAENGVQHGSVSPCCRRIDSSVATCSESSVRSSSLTESPRVEGCAARAMLADAHAATADLLAPALRVSEVDW